VIISSWNNTPAAAGGEFSCGASTPGFDVIVRDINNAPIANSQVKVMFGGTGTSIRPYQDVGPGPVTVHCIDHSITLPTDGNGRASFVPHFGRFAETNVVEVSADGVILGLIQARSPDYDCDGDVDVADLSTFSGDFLDTQAYHARSDFDDCPNTSLGDLLFFSAQFLASGAGSPRNVCP
jgi:hypothetical protein